MSDNAGVDFMRLTARVRLPLPAANRGAVDHGQAARFAATPPRELRDCRDIEDVHRAQRAAREVTWLRTRR